MTDIATDTRLTRLAGVYKTPRECQCHWAWGVADGEVGSFNATGSAQSEGGNNMNTLTTTARRRRHAGYETAMAGRSAARSRPVLACRFDVGVGRS